MPKRDMDDYVMVIEPYVLGDGTAFRYGEILHKDHPAVRAECVGPVAVRHDVEAMTAEPGEKRDVSLRRSRKRAAGE